MCTPDSIPICLPKNITWAILLSLSPISWNFLFLLDHFHQHIYRSIFMPSKKKSSQLHFPDSHYSQFLAPIWKKTTLKNYLVMISWLFTYVQTLQPVPIKYVQFFVYQLYLNKTIYKKRVVCIQFWVLHHSFSSKPIPIKILPSPLFQTCSYKSLWWPQQCQIQWAGQFSVLLLTCNVMWHSWSLPSFW